VTRSGCRSSTSTAHFQLEIARRRRQPRRGRRGPAMIVRRRVAPAWHRAAGSPPQPYWQSRGRAVSPAIYVIFTVISNCIHPARTAAQSDPQIRSCMCKTTCRNTCRNIRHTRLQTAGIRPVRYLRSLQIRCRPGPGPACCTSRRGDLSADSWLPFPLPPRRRRPAIPGPARSKAFRL
jgi:hypothetical protein